jgi:FMN phosphatase YigB (HAD superfamily)
MDHNTKPGIRPGSGKLVSLDIDHTMLNTFNGQVPAWRESLPVVAARLGISLDEACARMGAVIAKQLAHDYPWWLAHAFASIWQGSIEEFVEQVEAPFWAAQDRYMRTHIQVYPGVFDTLATLRDNGVKIICLTDATYYVALARLHYTGLAPFVDGVYALDVNRESSAVPSEEWLSFGDNRMRSFEEAYSRHIPVCHKLPESWSKPKPFGIWKACEDFGVNPADVYHAGDSLGKDVLLASTAGLKGSLWLPDNCVATLPDEDREWINKKLADPSVPWTVPSDVVAQLQGSFSDLTELVLGS